MVLYLKIYRHTKGHLDFLLHHRLEILYFCSSKFRPVVQRELTFVKGVRSASRFWFFFARGCPLAPAPCWEDSVFSIVLPFLLCQTSPDSLMAVSFWALSAVPLTCLSILLPISPCLDYSTFTVSLEMSYLQPSDLVLIFKCWVSCCGPFASIYKL